MQEDRQELSIHQTTEGDKKELSEAPNNRSESHSYAVGTKPLDHSAASEVSKDKAQFKYMKSMSTTMTFKEPMVVLRGQANGCRVPGLKNTASEMLPAHESLVPICDSLVGNGSAQP